MQAFVLCGGRGERLRPYTNDRPKPMVEVLGRPLLAYHLDWLQANGVTRAVLLVGYLANVIRDYFADRTPQGLQLTYVVEPEPLGRGGALRLGLESVSPEGETVVATNGDVVTVQPLRPLLEQHQRHPDALATVLLTPLPSPFGVVHVNGEDRVLRFEEKPRLPYWINAGVYVLSRRILQRLPEKGDHETSTFPELAQEGRLFACRCTSYWRSVDTAKDLRELGDVLPALSFSPKV